MVLVSVFFHRQWFQTNLWKIIEPMSQWNRMNNITEDPPEKAVVRGQSTTFQSTYHQSDIVLHNDKDSCTDSAPILPPQLEHAHFMPDLSHRAYTVPRPILSSMATYSSSPGRLASGFLHTITNNHELDVQRDTDQTGKHLSTVTSGQQGSVHSLNS